MGRLVRHEGWASRLFAELDECTGKTFSWGQFDCCIFAASCVEAMTGQRLLPDVSYSSKEEAQAILQDNDGLREMTTAALGEEPASPLTASRGDVVMRYDEVTEMLSLGICIGDQAAFPGARGVAYLSISDCICCWKVG